MEAGLFQRRVKGIPRNSDAWSDRGTQDHDLEDFEAYSDAEITRIAKFLHQQDCTRVPVAPDIYTPKKKSKKTPLRMMTMIPTLMTSSSPHR
jgi:hypothetical protein